MLANVPSRSVEHVFQVRFSWRCEVVDVGFDSDGRPQNPRVLLYSQ